jgi:putative membrane protein
MTKILLFFKGLFMGAADIIPGVSGGSIALITGIYEEFLDAIHSVNMDVLKDIFAGRIIQGIRRIHWNFILPLFFGILTAIFTMAKLMHYVLETYELYTWSLFFGLILASAFVIGKQWEMKKTRLITFIVGGISSFIIVGLVPIETPEDLWFIFFAGVIAISAMILPGISGAFLLLIMGKYHYITGILKDPFHLNSILILMVFGFGCLVGIMGFSRILRRILHRWHKGTLAFLTGMMLGSLRRIWPYKVIIEQEFIGDKAIILKEAAVLPWKIEGNYILSFVFILLGMVLILILDKFSKNKLG